MKSYINDYEILLLSLSLVLFLSIAVTIIYVYVSLDKPIEDNACVEVRMTMNKNEVHVMCGKLTKGIE